MGGLLGPNVNSKSPSLSIPSFHFSLQLALPTASNPFCSLPFCIPLYVFFLSRQSPTLSLFLRSRIWLFCFLSAFVYFMFFETPFLPSCRWLRPYNLYLLFLYCCILSPLFRTLGTLRYGKEEFSLPRTHAHFRCLSYGKEEFSLPRTHAHFPQAIFLPSTRQNGCCQKYIDKNTEHAAKRSFWINYRAF